MRSSRRLMISRPASSALRNTDMPECFNVVPSMKDWCRLGFGTAILAIRTPNEIVVAADSLRKFIDGRTELVCKIVQVGKVFFASSGLALSDGFDIQAIVTQAISERETIAARLVRLEELIEQPLREIYEHSRQDDNEAHKKVRELIQRHAVEVAIFGVEEISPVLSVRKFSPRDLSVGSEVRVCGEDNVGVGSEEPSYVALGYCKATMTARDLGIMRTTPGLEKDLAAFAQYVVQWEIDKQKGFSDAERFVGGPVDVLWLDEAGGRWIERKETCPEVEKRNTSPTNSG